MTSYIPEYTYGLIPGSYREGGPRYGLMPWPAHLRPREQSGVELTKKKGEAYVQAALAEAGGVFFLTLDRRDRTSIATTIERLINMLDAMDGDPDIEVTADEEPYLGWPNAGQSARLQMCDDRELDECDCEDGGDDEPTLGSSNDLRGADQTRWGAFGLYGNSDECEDVSEDEGAQDDREPELGWTERVDQTLAGQQEDEAWVVPDGEDDLGFVGHGTGWREGEGMEVRP